MILLEHTAGQGTSLGATFEQLASIIARTNDHRRVGVCLDTCHLLASGYDIASPEGYAATFTLFERLIGFDRLKVFHLNDSKKPLGSRVDRHEHIGQGSVGLEAFRRLVNDRRFEGLPMLLETPKEEGRSPSKIEVDRFDERNLNVLRGLIARQDRGHGKARRESSSLSSLRCPSCPSCPSRLPEHLRLESPELRALLPRVARQARLVAGLREERLPIPAPFGRHLRQQQPALPALLDDQPVTADFDVVRRRDRLERPEQRHLDLQAGQFRGADRREPRIGAAGGHGALANDAPRAVDSPR